MLPDLFRLPIVGWPIHTYGVLIVTGFLVALWIAYFQAKRYGNYYNEVMDFAFWALLGGMIGARVVYIIVEWREFFIVDPWTQVGAFKIPSVFAIWKGGLVYWGSFLGGFAAFLIYTKKHHIPRWMFADWCVLGIPLAQMFGRLGCVAAGCCYGREAYHLDAAGNVIADVPLALSYPVGSLAYSGLVQRASPETLQLMQHLHSTVPLFPSQLLESAGSVVVFAILAVMASRKWFHGQLVVMYAVLYSIMRSLIELTRGDTERGYVIDHILSTSQFISLLVITVAMIGFVVLKKHADKLVNS